MSVDAFVREYDDPKYFMSLMYLNFKNTLERLCLVKPLNISIFDEARNLKLISFFTDKLKGKKETSCDEYLTGNARKYFEVIFFVIDHAFFKSAYSLCNCLLYWNPSHFSISEYWNESSIYLLSF